MPIIGAEGTGKLPTAPTSVSATAGNASASVNFTPSTYVGRSGTVTYTATSSPGNITGQSSSSPIPVSGLNNGTAYSFTVTATTNYGVTGPASSASTPVTPSAPTPTPTPVPSRTPVPVCTPCCQVTGFISTCIGGTLYLLQTDPCCNTYNCPLYNTGLSC